MVTLQKLLDHFTIAIAYRTLHDPVSLGSGTTIQAPRRHTGMPPGTIHTIAARGVSSFLLIAVSMIVGTMNSEAYEKE
jgi:hypothetical protein